MRRAVIDPRLAVRIIAVRELCYTRPPAAGADRPHHVRAASGMAFVDGRLILVQDDAAFLGIVEGDHVDAIELPYAPGGRRRFEVALGNKVAKLDLEACVVVGDELWAFGSGALPVREVICRLAHGSLTPGLVDAAPLYRALRDAIAPVLNLEGVARVGDELWCCHRGNTGAGDPGPAIARLALGELHAWLAGGAVPRVLGVERYDLGAVGGSALGFTDAVADGAGGVLYLAAAEASPDAIDDGPVAGSQLGVIRGETVRAAALAGPDGAPLKAEAIALDPERAGRVWIAADPDDPERPSPLLEVELVGPW